MISCRVRGCAGRLARLRRDEEGAAIIEFALIMPLIIIMLIGAIELALVVFVGASIEAAVLEASRFGITGSGTSVTRQERIREIISERTFGFVDMDKVDIDTLVYSDFSSIGQPEPFTDENGNGSYDEGEVFVDVNGNAQWDPDMGEAGLGEDDDIVLYRVSYEWGILTPLMRELLGRSVNHVSAVAMRNEEF
ncbi:TadE/TadG family type IV pilus assembly protein [Amaricoccus macauensis]|uniref:TadE/TadG family type IV pilus assembly protein n=1 Tax=Amaricoccus macauensis TaxID=57001 RepID=UPI003C7DDEC6